MQDYIFNLCTFYKFDAFRNELIFLTIDCIINSNNNVPQILMNSYIIYFVFHSQGSSIWTNGPSLPTRALYQTELHPVVNKFPYKSASGFPRFRTIVIANFANMIFI